MEYIDFKIVQWKLPIRKAENQLKLNDLFRRSTSDLSGPQLKKGPIERSELMGTRVANHVTCGPCGQFDLRETYRIRSNELQKKRIPMIRM